MRRLIAILLLLCLEAQGKLEDHFKKIDSRSPVHKMRNIDFIYMINLDKRPEKFAQSANELIQFGIIPCRFSAVNGWELSLETINDVGLKYRQGITTLLATAYPLEANG